VYDVHSQALFAYLLSFTRDEQDTRDALQEVFVKLARQPDLLSRARQSLLPAKIVQSCSRLRVGLMFYSRWIGNTLDNSLTAAFIRCGFSHLAISLLRSERPDVYRSFDTQSSGSSNFGLTCEVTCLMPSLARKLLVEWKSARTSVRS
jgi:hypothetical protein